MTTPRGLTDPVPEPPVPRIRAGGSTRPRLDFKWVVQWRVHESQAENGTWVWVDAANESDGRAWFDRIVGGEAVIEARLVRMEPTVVREWRR